MNKTLIQKNVEIAIGMLAGSRTDRQGNRRIDHLHRNYITQTVTELLELILIEVEEDDALSIPKSPSNINLPEET